jgi:hypothetical protein
MAGLSGTTPAREDSHRSGRIQTSASRFRPEFLVELPKEVQVLEIAAAKAVFGMSGARRFTPP